MLAGYSQLDVWQLGHGITSAAGMHTWLERASSKGIFTQPTTQRHDRQAGRGGKRASDCGGLAARQAGCISCAHFFCFYASGLATDRPTDGRTTQTSIITETEVERKREEGKS